MDTITKQINDFLEEEGLGKKINLVDELNNGEKKIDIDFLEMELAEISKVPLDTDGLDFIKTEKVSSISELTTKSQNTYEAKKDYTPFMTARELGVFLDKPGYATEFIAKIGGRLDNVASEMRKERHNYSSGHIEVRDNGQAVVSFNSYRHSPGKFESQENGGIRLKGGTILHGQFIQNLDYADSVSYDRTLRKTMEDNGFKMNGMRMTSNKLITDYVLKK